MPPDAINPDRWEELKALFSQVLAQPATERAAWVAQVEDPAMRAELAQLLAGDEGTLSLLDVPHDRLVQLIDDPLADDAHIGPYHLVREIGQGGMGTVYLAHRADGTFEQRVALKVIRPGHGSADIVRRFQQERQILASLHHPHIAQLLDGGTTDAGAPYFAMEYIDGEPLTTYCDDHRLSVDDRLRLFQDACAAVHYAHQNLVVHRDLKPSNMLVTEDGQLKLLDFGIAKILNPQQPDTLQTRTGARVLTPAYASPEQHTGAPISTASDVYTLGVILYELLTGQRPHDDATADTPPPRPSTVVTTTADAPTRSKARSTTTERLRRRLAGDLDTIVLKALRPEPALRYSSAEAFQEDIRRHLNGLPVLARKDTPGYRLRKFVQRHKAAAIAAVLVLLSLAGGLGAALWQAAEKTQEAAKAEEVKAFVLDLFAQANPDVAQGEALTVKELVDQGAERVKTGLADQPEVQAEMLLVLAEVYFKLGTYDAALALLQDMRPVVETRFGPSSEQSADVLHQLGVVQMERAQYDDADSLLHEALRIRRARRGATDLAVAQTLFSLGSLRSGTRQGRPEEAVLFFQEAYAIRQAQLDKDHPDLLESINGLAVIRGAQDDHAEAEVLFRDLLERQRLALGPGHTQTLRTLNNLAITLDSQQKYDEAIEVGREVVALRKASLGEHHPDYAVSLDALAGFLMNGGRAEDAMEAEALYRQALGIFRAELGDAHPSVAQTLGSLSLALVGLNDYAGAVAATREALALHLQTLGAEHPRIVVDRLFLAKALYNVGAYEESDAYFRAAQDLAQHTWNKEHLIFADLFVHHGQLLQEQGRCDEAEPMLEEGLRLSSHYFGDQYLMPALAKLSMGQCLLRNDQYADAESFLLASYAFFESTPDEEAYTDNRAALVDLYTAWGKPEQAAAYR